MEGVLPKLKKKRRKSDKEIAEESNKRYCYLKRRLQSENLRRYVVGLVIRPDLFTSKLVEDAEDVKKYYNYVKSGIDTRIYPLDSDTINNVVSLVPSKWRERFENLIEMIKEEVKEDYLTSVKKSIIEFVLTDPDAGTTEKVTVLLNLILLQMKKKKYRWLIILFHLFIFF